MALSTQMKLLRAVKEILSGDGRNIFPTGNETKPDLPKGTADSYIPLPRSTPERQGVPSKLLDTFVREIANDPNCFAHSLMIVRNGQVIAEGSFAPYRKDIWHIGHSFSKTITGSAVGIAVSEGLFGLDDKIADYFPEDLPVLSSRRLKKIKIRHLLEMSSGISFNEISEAVEVDWVKGIFAAAIDFEPGSKFVYNSMNSYLLSALVHKTSGQIPSDYLEERLLQPMGFNTFGWEKCPMGNEKGGWGMYITLEDMARLGQLYLQKGRWTVNGKERQLLPARWVQTATQKHMVGENQEEYGYHIWVDSKNQTYIMNGLFGQYVLVIPHLNLVIAMTSGNSFLFTDSPAYKIMQDTFYPVESLNDSLPEDPAAYHQLQQTLGSLQFNTPLSFIDRRNHRVSTRHYRVRKPLPGGQAVSSDFEPFCGTTWEFSKNRAGLLPLIPQALDNNFSPGIDTIRLEPQTPGVLLLTWKEGNAVYKLQIGTAASTEQTIIIGKERFLISCHARVRQNEDRHPVLRIEICFLEHSSYRLIKMYLHNNNLLLKLDETPQLMEILQSAIQRDEDSGVQNAGPAAPLGGIVYSNDYVHYRLNQLCAPELIGHKATIKPPVF